MRETAAHGWGTRVVIRAVVVFVVGGAAAAGLRLAQVEQFAGGRMVAPGADGIEIGLELRVVQLGGDAFARELRVPMRVERLHHHHADAERVDAGPGLRLVVQQAELGWKRILVLRR